MEDGMERACGINKRCEKCIQTFCFKDLKGLHHSEHRWHRGEGNIEMDLRKNGLEDVDWIHLVQNRDW
jgi:hypothetical protein